MSVVMTQAPPASRAAWRSIVFPILAGLFALVGGRLLLGLVADTDGLFAAAGHMLARVAHNGFVLYVGSMLLVAVVTVHLDKGFFNANGGWELPAMVIAGALAIDFGGMGKYTLDHLIGPTVFTAGSVRLYLIAGAVVLALLTLAARRKAPQQTAKPSST